MEPDRKQKMRPSFYRHKCTLFVVTVILIFVPCFAFYKLFLPIVGSRVRESGTLFNSKSSMSGQVTYPRVILYGDSITQYSFSDDGQWGALITDQLQRKCDVINRGYAGYTTRYNLMMLKRVFSGENPKNVAAVTIFLGANDSNKPESSQHVPLEEYSSNMKKMLEELQALGISKNKIIIIGTPPVDEQAWGVSRKQAGTPMTKDNQLAGKYAEAGAKVAKETGVSHVDLYQSMMKEKNWRTFFADGLHFSAAGSKFLYDKLWPVLAPLTESLPMIMPLWDQVDPQNPAATLL